MRLLALLWLSLASAGCSDPLADSLPPLPGGAETVPGGDVSLDIEYPIFESRDLPAGGGTLRRYAFKFRNPEWYEDVEITMLPSHGAFGAKYAMARVSVLGPGRDVWTREADSARLRVPLGLKDGAFRVIVDARSTSDEVRFVLDFRD